MASPLSPSTSSTSSSSSSSSSPSSLLRMGYGTVSNFVKTYMTIIVVNFIYITVASAVVPAADPSAAGSPASATTDTLTAFSTALRPYAPLPLPTFNQQRRRKRNEEPYTAGGLFSGLLSSNMLVKQQDICSSHCNCLEHSNSLITIDCDFNANKKLPPVFGQNFLIPSKAISLNITLGPYTNFRIENGLFQNNKINRLHIRGNLKQGEQVEIVPRAFEGNKGPYPDIQIIGCNKVILRSNAFSGDLQLIIRQSYDVTIFSNAFNNTRVRGTFDEIHDLSIAEKAFNSAEAKLNISNSRLHNLYRIEASIKEIYFYNCSIGIVNTGTFDVNQIDSIQFEECTINTIKYRAFTDKLLSKHVAIIGTRIENIETQAFSGCGIEDLILSGNIIEEIQSNAINVSAAINISIHENNITYAFNDWITFSSLSNISVRKNKFGKFGHMSLETASPSIKSCKFDGNSLTQPQKSSLNLPFPSCQIREVFIDHPCNCNTTWLEALTPRDLRSETYCTIDEKLKFCFNTKVFTVLKYLNEVCDESKTEIDCLKNGSLQKKNGDFYTQEELNNSKKTTKTIIAAVIIGVIFVVGIIILIIAIYARKRCRKPSIPTSAMPIPTAPPPYDHIYAEVREQTDITSEPLYEEPGNVNVQQHLLPESTQSSQELLPEYSSPRDGRNNMGDLYSEPINERAIHNMPLYATTDLSQSTIPSTITSMKVQQHSPQRSSKSHNLPDVLGQSSRGTIPKPSTNVRRMAQNVELSQQSNAAPYYTEVKKFQKGIMKPCPFRGIPVKDSTSDSVSDHSGGSDVTVKIDDIEYADSENV